MSIETGIITVNAERIFPIIKKSLYPHREIFLRELISNATDALNRFHFLSIRDTSISGDREESRIDIYTDKTVRTISIEDNGDGMTRDEVKTNINEVAFSGTQKFIETYNPDVKMIGYFGLGFYSIFMVAKEARLETKSYKSAEEACLWSSKGDGQFKLEVGNRVQRGTKITLFLEPGHEEFLESELLEKLIRKYSDYMPFPIYLNGRCVNTIHAPWHLSKNELTSKDYLDFYQKLCPNANDPLFWIHLDIEGQVNLRGLLYVPDRLLKNGNIRLFCNRVFVQEYCLELIPEFLSFIEGVIDTEDLPLNVSRDKFQEDRNTKIIKNHLTKRVAREIVAMAQKRRADYMRLWEVYGEAIKTGAFLNEEWFAELSSYFMFPSSKKTLTTIQDYLERVTNKHSGEVYYLTDRVQQSQHLSMFRQRDLEVLYMDNEMDFLILKRLREESGAEYELKRIDTVAHKPREEYKDEKREDKDAQANWNAFKAYIAELVPKEVSISIEALPAINISGIFKMQAEEAEVDEAANLIKRILNTDMPGRKRKRIFVLNEENTLVQALFNLFVKDKSNSLLAKICLQIYKHVLISTGEIKTEDLGTILANAEEIMISACQAEIQKL
jgi:molecular chaperone HtpG